MATVTFLHNGVQIEVPNDPEGEREAVAAHPEYQRRLAASRAEADAGIPIEEYAARRGVDLTQRPRVRGRKPVGASGKLNVRLPIHLHKELVEQATRDGVSLNTLIVGLLERGVGAAKAVTVAR